MIDQVMECLWRYRDGRLTEIDIIQIENYAYNLINVDGHSIAWRTKPNNYGFYSAYKGNKAPLRTAILLSENRDSRENILLTWISATLQTYLKLLEGTNGIIPEGCRYVRDMNPAYNLMKELKMEMRMRYGKQFSYHHTSSNCFPTPITSVADILDRHLPSISEIFSDLVITNALDTLDVWDLVETYPVGQPRFTYNGYIYAPHVSLHPYVITAFA